MLAEENRSRGIKIKVGTYSNSSKKQVLLESIKKKDIAQQTASAAASKAAISVTSSTTLYDLCDSSYNLKFCKRERKKKGAVTAEEKLAAEVKNKNATLENSKTSSSSSSSSSSKRSEKPGMGPRVEIVNGKIIVRESSLEVNQESSFVDNDGEYEEVVEGNHATATYSSFLKTRHSFAWGIEETRLFYQCLRQCGTDFSIMQSFFPGRTRKQLITKFYREEKQHPELIKIALSTTLPLEIIPFESSKTEKASSDVAAESNTESASPVALATPSEDSADATGGDLKRSAAAADLSDSPDRKRSGESCAAANPCVSVVTAQVHIELIDDEEETFFDV